MAGIDGVTQRGPPMASENFTRPGWQPPNWRSWGKFPVLCGKIVQRQQSPLIAKGANADG